MALTLIIGNKNYSSWSLRPWIAMKVAGIPFSEMVVPLDTPEFKPKVTTVSGSGKVPALADGDVHVWESLAILEHLAEKFPASGLWPREAAARAHARVIAAEMHAGFAALRNHCPMNMRRPPKARALTPEVAEDVKRIEAIWADSRARFGRSGPFLLGAFCAADAMYAPVVSRFSSYAIPVGAPARAYMQTMMGLPVWKEWAAAAAAEPWVMPGNELD